MNIGIYPRKLFFFALVVFLGIIGFRFYSSSASQVKADKIFASPADNINMSGNSNDYYLELDLKDDGSVYIGNKKAPEGVKILSNRDELRYIILDQPQSYFESAEIIVNLPKKLNRLVEDPEIIAVHGAVPWGALLLEDGKRIVYKATNVGSSATITITAAFPKGYFNFPASKVVGYKINSIPAIAWLVGGAVFPPIALLVFLYMFFKSNRSVLNKKIRGLVEVPPGNLPPAIVNALVFGRVGPHTIVSTLVDLAQRGYIDIYNRDNDFVIYRKTTTPKQDAHLRTFEKVLLEKIFLPMQKKVGSFDVEARISRHLFSRKIAIFYLDVYGEASSLGYFAELPARVHLKYRLFGILTFFLGLAGYLLFAIFAPDPKTILFFWISAIFLGILIVNLAPKLTVFTQRGKVMREKWLQFRNFLSEEEFFRGDKEIFEVYLPYAIALGVEAEWAARFAKESYEKPDWYDYAGRVEGVEGFVKSFLPVVDFIGESLNLSSEPLVK